MVTLHRAVQVGGQEVHAKAAREGRVDGESGEERGRVEPSRGVGDQGHVVVSHHGDRWVTVQDVVADE